MGVTQSWSGHFGREKNLLPYRELNHGLSIIAMLTMPHQLPLHEKSAKNTTNSNSTLGRKDGRTSVKVYGARDTYEHWVQKAENFLLLDCSSL